MTELERIKSLEYYFPRIFADVEERDFGVMFYNTSNPTSHDSNHAIIINNCDYEKAIVEVREFYLSMNLTPMIYSSLEDDQLQRNRQLLERNGFKIDDFGYNDFLVYSGKSDIPNLNTLDFRRFKAGDDLSVFAQFHADDEGIFRVQEVIRRRSLCPDYYLYVGYMDKIPVVMASLQFDENMTARMDEVETVEAHRGKGYARQVTRHLTDVFEKQGGKLFYSWAANDTAQRVYLQGGFEAKYRLPAWSAYIGEENEK